MSAITQKLHGTIPAGATTNGIAAVDVSEDAILTGVLMNIFAEWGTVVTGSNTVMGEVSFLATNQLTTNDARGSICQIVCSGTILSTTGGYKMSESIWILPDVKVFAGERIYIHGDSSVASLIGSLDVIMFFDTIGSGSGRRSSARR